MTVLTAKELADMRLVADDFLPDTCTIQTVTKTVDALGGITHTWANTYTSVACRIDPTNSGNEVVSNLALEGQATWWLNIPYTQAIDIEDRVIHDSVTYEVAHVWDTHSYKTIRRAILVRVN